MKTPDFDQAREYAISRLKNELSPKLTYHRLEHTTDEVVPSADRLASLEAVSDEDRLLLLTGAYYHDLGFIYQRQGHESYSIKLAEEILPTFGYTKDQLAVIRGIIQATRIPQSPTNLLGMIMADADLDYLGQESFWIRSNDLRKELENYWIKFEEKDWHAYQLHFIKAHQYFTASERSLRDGIKRQHMVEIQKQFDKEPQLK